jgi:hypothetical protein
MLNYCYNQSCITGMYQCQRSNGYNMNDPNLRCGERFL